MRRLGRHRTFSKRKLILYGLTIVTFTIIAAFYQVTHTSSVRSSTWVIIPENEVNVTKDEYAEKSSSQIYEEAYDVPLNFTNGNLSFAEWPVQPDTKLHYTHLNFEYTNHSQKVHTTCTRKITPPFIMVLVNSAANHFIQRQNIRNSWGSLSEQREHKFSMIFVVAIDEAVRDKLSSEIQQFNDTIQGNFTESYHDMIRKLSMCFHWFNHFCKNATYFLKTDDDMLLSMRRINYGLRGIRMKTKNAIVCNVMINYQPHRLPESKWFVSQDDFPRNDYPPFCRGSMVIMESDLVSKLYFTSPFAPYIWLEDVFWTGLVPEKLGNVTFIPWNKHGRYPSTAGQMRITSFVGSWFVHMTIPSRTIKLWDNYKHWRTH